jgi:hypothetical protein
MEDVDIFYGQLVHFTVFCYILWTFGLVCGNLVYFFPFWYFVQSKIWQPWSSTRQEFLFIIQVVSFFGGLKGSPISCRFYLISQFAKNVVSLRRFSGEKTGPQNQVGAIFSERRLTADRWLGAEISA